MVNRTNHGCWLGQSAGFYPITFYDLSGGRMAPPKIPFTHPTITLVMQSSKRPRKLIGEPPSYSELPSLTQYAQVIERAHLRIRHFGPKAFVLSLRGRLSPSKPARAKSRRRRQRPKRALCRWRARSLTHVRRK